MGHVICPSARHDLRTIVAYLRRERGESVALRFVAAFTRTASRLGAFPQLGHFRAGDVQFRYHSVVGTKYLVVYEWAVTPIRIVHVVHGMRDLSALFRDP